MATITDTEIRELDREAYREDAGMIDVDTSPDVMRAATLLGFAR